MFGERNIFGEKPIAVIICHGFKANQSYVKKYAKAAVSCGYAAYTFDFCGGCIGGLSDGRSTEMSVLTEKMDLKVNISCKRFFTHRPAEEYALFWFRTHVFG